LLLIFGRVADHLAVGNCLYEMDTDVPFSLWVSSKWCRRLKNQHPQWLPLFRGTESVARGEFEPESVTRASFKRAMQALPFKWPLATGGQPAPIPVPVLASFPGLTHAALKKDGDLRDQVNANLSALSLGDRALDSVFSMLAFHFSCAASRSTDPADTLTRSAFELKCVEWASEDPEQEADPVLTWDVFEANVAPHLLRAPSLLLREPIHGA
jgi:hypothetical protein